MAPNGLERDGYELGAVLLLFAAVAVAALASLGPGLGSGVVAVLAVAAMVRLAAEWAEGSPPR
jgi:hypothetical protein